MARATTSRQLIASPSTMPASATTTTTITLETASPSNQQQPQIRDSIILKLKPPKKNVSWKEGTVDNEFMNKKSSKKCCIFHKEKPFDEDDSDDEGDYDHDHSDADRNGNHSHESDETCCANH